MRHDLHECLIGAAEWVSPGVAELISRLPGTPTGIGGDSVVAFPADERAVWEYNSQGPAVPLDAVYPSDGSLRLDYPYLVLPLTASIAVRSAASATLLDALLDASTRGAILAAGLRLPDGTGTPEHADSRGIRRVAPEPAKPATRDEASMLLRSWTMLTAANRSPVLFDVSGSMADQVLGVGQTRMQLTSATAQYGLALFPDSAELGAWAFSTDLTPKTDYVELVSIGALSDPVGKVTRRAALSAALGGLRPKPNGGAGLYDSVLAAYRTLWSSYKRDMVNSLVVLTDGRNDDRQGVSLDVLLEELAKLRDPARPLPVIFVGMGDDVDAAAMERIADATGGGSYLANDPADVRDVFRHAVGERVCRPDC